MGWAEDLAKKAAKAAGIDPSIVDVAKEAGKKGGQYIEDQHFKDAFKAQADKPSEMAEKLDKFMDEQGIKRGKHKEGTITKGDVKALKEHLEEVAKTTPDLKGEFRVNDKEHTIELTKKGLDALKIEAPAKEKGASLPKSVTGGIDVAANDAPNARGNGGPRQLG